MFGAVVVAFAAAAVGGRVTQLWSLAVSFARSARSFRSLRSLCSLARSAFARPSANTHTNRHFPILALSNSGWLAKTPQYVRRRRTQNRPQRRPNRPARTEQLKSGAAFAAAAVAQKEQAAGNCLPRRIRFAAPRATATENVRCFSLSPSSAAASPPARTHTRTRFSLQRGGGKLSADVDRRTDRRTPSQHSTRAVASSFPFAAPLTVKEQSAGTRWIQDARAEEIDRLGRGPGKAGMRGPRAGSRATSSRRGTHRGGQQARSRAGP